MINDFYFNEMILTRQFNKRNLILHYNLILSHSYAEHSSHSNAPVVKYPIINRIMPSASLTTKRKDKKLTRKKNQRNIDDFCDIKRKRISPLGTLRKQQTSASTTTLKIPLSIHRRVRYGTSTQSSILISLNSVKAFKVLSGKWKVTLNFWWFSLKGWFSVEGWKVTAKTCLRTWQLQLIASQQYSVCMIDWVGYNFGC